MACIFSCPNFPYEIVLVFYFKFCFFPLPDTFNFLDDGYNELDFHTCGEASPLGLTLKKTPSFLNLVEMTLSHSRTSHDDFVPQLMSEKLKASNFPALLVKIGSWEHNTEHGYHSYYAKKKIVWEVLERALKSKIKIQC
ncbi:hypothetical protein CsSME_00025325 [Camellia sinensis var. sinensis]